MPEEGEEAGGDDATRYKKQTIQASLARIVQLRVINIGRSNGEGQSNHCLSMLSILTCQRSAPPRRPLLLARPRPDIPLAPVLPPPFIPVQRHLASPVLAIVGSVLPLLPDGADEARV